MAYGYPYSGYYPAPVADQLQQMRTGQFPQVPQPQNNSGITWVSGEAGAKAYLVAAGSSMLLMDSEASRFYIKSTDASGMPMPLRVFDYTERVQAANNAPVANKTAGMDFVTREEFAALTARIDAITQEVKKDESAV